MVIGNQKAVVTIFSLVLSIVIAYIRQSTAFLLMLLCFFNGKSKKSHKQLIL